MLKAKVRYTHAIAVILANKLDSELCLAIRVGHCTRVGTKIVSCHTVHHQAECFSVDAGVPRPCVGDVFR